MRISLIYPLLSKSRSLIDENKQYWPPLGLAYIASVLEKAGHSIQILDRDQILHQNGLDFDKADEVAINLVKNFNSDLVGFSVTTPNVSDADYFSKKLKAQNSRINTVIGGPHCIGEPVATLKMCAGIDMLVRGEGEMTMLEIANARPVKEILGLSYKQDDGEVVSNQDRPLIDILDDLPLPARHLLDMNFYTRPSRFISRNLALRTTHVFTTRGCPYNCHYCAGPLIGQRKVRYHAPGRVISEIEELIDKYSIEAIYFADDMFLSNKNRASEIIDLFIQSRINKKIVWMAQLSPKVVDEKFLSKMKSAGCVHVEYGFESGSQRMLELMNKKSNVEENKKVAALTKKVGLRFQGNFIVGYPGETEDDFNKTIYFIKQTIPNNISLNLFMPLPGTEVYKKLGNEGKLIYNWDEIGNPEVPYINYADMPAFRFEQLYFSSKLKVILPLNLMNFLKDNIRHPLRLIYVISTQFKSVVFRAFKAMAQLRKIKKSSATKIDAIFIAYHSAAFPIMESQGFSYIRNLSKKGINYFILTFETEKTLDASRKIISGLGLGFKWKFLFYHRRPRVLATSFDILCGMFTTFFILKKYKIKIIHARGLIPAVIAFIPAKLCRVKLFFDTRGLLADKYVGGGLLRENSPVYGLMRRAEDSLIRWSDYFTVETDRHAQMIKHLGNGISKKMKVIPCCVDIKKFNNSSRLAGSKAEDVFNLVYLGKIGAWYLLEEMLDFFKVLSTLMPNSSFIFITQDDPELIYSAAKRKDIMTQRIFVEKLSIQEIPMALAKADMGIFFINPYKRYNSSPIKYGEYLAAGLPVVINPGIGDTEDITKREKVGVVIKDFSSASYDAAARASVDLMKEGQALSKRCKDTAEKYLSLENGVGSYWDIYQKLLG